MFFDDQLDMRFAVDNRPEWDRVELYFGLKGTRHEPIVFRDSLPEEEGTARKPSLRISPASATELMNSLWRAGFRPDPACRDESGAMDAKNAHIEDLRAIAYHVLKIPKTGK